MLVQCPDCHTSYSSQATACPKCGYQKFNVVKNVNDSLFWFRRIVIIVAIAVAIAIFCISLPI